MKTKLLTVSLVIASLFGCASNKQFSEDTYGQRAKQQAGISAEEVKRTVDESPDWMKKLPTSTNAVYANGTALSNDYEMAVNKAKLHALGKICMTAGGSVDRRSRTFQSDSDDVTTSNSENAIQANCKGVDVTGAEPVDQKIIPAGNRFRAYVLMALPIGSANELKRENRQHELQIKSLERSKEVFQEMKNPATPVSGSEIKETVLADYSRSPDAETAKTEAIKTAIERAKAEKSQVIQLSTTIR
jgi:hypothetical protein